MQGSHKHHKYKQRHRLERYRFVDIANAARVVALQEVMLQGGALGRQPPVFLCGGVESDVPLVEVFVQLENRGDVAAPDVAGSVEQS